MKAYAVVYRNKEWESFCDEGYYHMWCVRPKGEREFGAGFHVSSQAEAEGLVAALSQPYTLHTLCKTPECAMEAVGVFEGREVLGMATIAVEAEPVSGMAYRLRAHDEPRYELTEAGRAVLEGEG